MSNNTPDSASIAKDVSTSSTTPTTAAPSNSKSSEVSNAAVPGNSSASTTQRQSAQSATPSSTTPVAQNQNTTVSGASQPLDDPFRSYSNQSQGPQSQVSQQSSYQQQPAYYYQQPQQPNSNLYSQQYQAYPYYPTQPINSQSTPATNGSYPDYGYNRYVQGYNYNSAPQQQPTPNSNYSTVPHPSSSTIPASATNGSNSQSGSNTSNGQSQPSQTTVSSNSGSIQPAIAHQIPQGLPQSQQITPSSIGQVQPVGSRPRVTTTMWEDEKTLCYQVDANGVSVVRRADNNMINGTKLLNVAHMTRGRRDGILKSEKTRDVVKIGSMHLKGVWIPFDRALAMAQKEGIVDLLYPLFVRDIKQVIQQGTTTQPNQVPQYNYSQHSSTPSASVASNAPSNGQYQYPYQSGLQTYYQQPPPPSVPQQQASTQSISQQNTTSQPKYEANSSASLATNGDNSTSTSAQQYPQSTQNIYSYPQYPYAQYSQYTQYGYNGNPSTGSATASASTAPTTAASYQYNYNYPTATGPSTGTPAGYIPYGSGLNGSTATGTGYEENKE
ncbi:hypothetical protein WICMUC_000803 [Wickerhamomyces mucosus]|uniref:HTH APSES-type domain-containing protein n=1 Tax=Wickerhamomyces mucosus TaxID=1378264 RepID=A0A9P8PWD9_9ASCO|nr:hypothetical protein WICMUC_000803 [Wickerhamomyces mucosus]